MTRTGLVVLALMAMSISSSGWAGVRTDRFPPVDLEASPCRWILAPLAISAGSADSPKLGAPATARKDRDGAMDPGWLAIGSGSAALAAGTALFVHAYSRPLSGGDWSSPGEILRDQAHTEIAIGWSLGAAGALAVGGGLLWLLHPEVLPFHLAALPAPNGGSLLASGSF